MNTLFAENLRKLRTERGLSQKQLGKQFALSMYGLILSDQIEQNLRHQQEIARQQQEIARQRTSIMVLQMRPHFIYNTMTSIYCLCSQDPEKAQYAKSLFVEYDTPHTVLDNIRQRMELMCSGKMTIMPRDGGGTVIRLTIPRQGG